MQRLRMSRWAVLIVMLMGLIAPTLSAAASAAPASPARASSSLAGVDLLLAQADDKKQPDDSASGDEALIGVLGGTRADFEDEFGEPADDADADEFSTGVIYEDIRGYDTIQVYWSEDDIALRIILNASRDWTESRAMSQAEDFLPADVDLDSEPEELDGGELLYLGASDALADVTDRTTYRDLEVGGRPGDLRVIMIPGDDDKFATVDIAIGQGDDFTGGSTSKTTTTKTTKTTKEETPEPEPTKKSTSKKSTTSKSSSADADQYLSDVRDLVDQRQEEINRFYEIIGNASNATDADFEELVNIVTSWTTVPELDAPEGYEDLDDAVSAMNDDFMNAAVSFATWLSDTEANADSLDDMSASLKSAQTNLDTVDSLLKDEGV